MSSPIEDFIVSLGFDTTKIKSQIQDLHKSLEKLAVGVDAKRVKNGLKAEKQISDNAVKVAETTAKKKESVEAKAADNKVKRVKKVEKEITATQQRENERRKKAAKLDTTTRRKVLERNARNAVAEYERGTVGPSNASQRLERMLKMNGSNSQLRAFTEEFRTKNADTRNRMKAEGSLKSFDSAAASKADLDLLKANNAIATLRTTMQKLGMDTAELDKKLSSSKDLNSLKTLRENTATQIKQWKILNSEAKKRADIQQDADAHVSAFQKERNKIEKKRIKDEEAAARKAEQQRLKDAAAEVKRQQKELKDKEKVEKKLADSLQKQKDAEARKAEQQRLRQQAAAIKAEQRRLREVASAARKAEKAAATASSSTKTKITMEAITQGGGFKGYTSQQQAMLVEGAQRQGTQKGADAFVRAARDAERYRKLGGGKIDEAIASGNIDRLRTVTKELARMNHELEKQRRHSLGAAAAMSSLHDSTRNMVREYASLYALFAGTTYFKEQVKALDSMNASILAVSDNSEQAADTVGYLKGVIVQNGLSLKDTTKDFVKLRAAMQGKYSLDETKMAFESLTKSGVILQLSQDDMAGTVKAVSQMFSKQQVMAQELKEQLGDRLPIAMRALEKSTGKTAKELFKMMEQGQLGAEYILPFVLQMEKLVNVNDAYTKSLDKLGIVENRMKTAFSVNAAENLDKGGFTEGLKNFYKTLIDLVNENTNTLERLGGIYKKVFDGLSVVVRMATQLFASFLRVVESVGDTIGWFVDNPIAGLIVSMPIIIRYMKTLGTVMAAAFKTPLAILTMIIGVLDEIRAYFDDDVVGLFDDKGWSDEQSKKIHAQRRIFMGAGSAEDYQIVGGDSKLNPLAKFGQDIAKNSPLASQTDHGYTVLAVLEGFAKTSLDYTMAGLKDFTSWYSKNTIGGNISITVNSPDPEKAGENVKRELERVVDMQSAGVR